MWGWLQTLFDRLPAWPKPKPVDEGRRDVMRGGLGLLVTIPGQKPETGGLSLDESAAITKAFQNIFFASARIQGNALWEGEGGDYGNGFFNIGKGETNPEKIRHEIAAKLKYSLSADNEIHGDYSNAYLLFQNLARRFPGISFARNQEALKETEWHNPAGGEISVADILKGIQTPEITLTKMHQATRKNWSKSKDDTEKWLHHWEVICKAYDRLGAKREDAELALKRFAQEDLFGQIYSDGPQIPVQRSDKDIEEIAVKWQQEGTLRNQDKPQPEERDALSDMFHGLSFQQNASGGRCCYVQASPAELKQLQESLLSLLALHDLSTPKDWPRKFFEGISYAAPMPPKQFMFRMGDANMLEFSAPQVRILTDAAELAQRLAPSDAGRLGESLAFIAQFSRTQMEREQSHLPRFFDS